MPVLKPIAQATFLLISMMAFAGLCTPLSQTQMSDKGNADHGSMIFGYIWRNPVAYGENDPVPCDSEASEDASKCVIKLNFAGISSVDATEIIVRIKAKAFANPSNIGPAAYCQLAVSSTNERALANNYFIHAEAYGTDQRGDAQRRNVQYTEASISVDSPGLMVTKEIYGECEVEFAVYFEGQIVSRSAFTQLFRNVVNALPLSLKDSFIDILHLDN